MPQGIALLDAPDVDSISDDNRRLAGQLLAAADLWVFVTTANRYADAVPWRLLLDAASRDIMVAVVLDRVPPAAEEEVSADLQAMLSREGLGSARLFVVPRWRWTRWGCCPPTPWSRCGGWLQELAADAAGRAGDCPPDAQRHGQGAGRPGRGRRRRRRRPAAAPPGCWPGTPAAPTTDAVGRILDATRDGALLRGEVLARWQDFVGTGEFFRVMEQNIGRLRDRMGAFFRGEPAPAVQGRRPPIETGLQAVILDEAANAAEDADQRWRSDPAGRQLLGTDDLSGTSEGFADAVAAEIRAWQGRPDGADPDRRPRQAHARPAGSPLASTASAPP